ncbi:hypothetical protein PG991_010503 [Apiospora marii]|uniref:NACHT domain-containing protein n=1 Tax=Apiospora marii TaxID=335849 RepID=A0ABR1RCL6_9PEZI
MADPLSIAASIAGVVTLADLVFGRLYKYAKAANDAPAEAKELTALVNDLGGLLNSLARLARALEGESFDVSLRIQHVDACHFVLSKLDRMLQKADKDLGKPSQLDKLQRKLKWPISTSQIKEYLEELSTHKERISFALSADSMNGLLQCLSFERKILDATENIRQDIRETRKITTRIEETSERSKILSAFLKHNPQESYDMSLSLRHPRTGLWLLRLPAFQTWLDTPGSKLWLSGIPGAGKTVLAASIIEAALARSSGKVAVAFYFCDYKTESTWNPSTILSVIAAQLALQSEEAYGELASFYDQLHPQTGFQGNPGKFDQVFIIVDALDECGEHTTSVVETLTSYANDHDNVCAALLSRDEDEIRFGLGGDFENMEIAAHTEDVAEYVSSEIQERVRTGRLRVGDNDLLADIQRTLLDHLGECYSDRSRREALDTLPPDLEETYVRLLQRIKPSQESLVSMSLNLIGYLSNLLSIPMLQHALSVRPDMQSMSPQDVVYEDAISRACSSLIRKTNDGKYFEFAHFSVREFLESDRLNRIGLGHFQISRSRCSGMFTTQCLRYLQLDNFKYNIASAAFSYSYGEITSSNFAFPLYHLASLHWLRHVRVVWACNDEVRGLAEKLFDRRKTPSFISWAAHLLDGLHCLLLKDSTENALPSRDQIRQLDMSMAVIDSRFTPLHLGAMLGLHEISQKLISEGNDPSLPSQLGTPLSFAVSSVGALRQGTDVHSSSESSLLIRFIHQEEDWQTTFHDISRTVSCILDAQKSISPTCTLTANPTLMRDAIITCGVIADFSMITTLLQHGVEPVEEDYRAFGEKTSVLCQCIAHGYPLQAGHTGERFIKSLMETRMEAFIKSLNSMIDVSQSAFSLCCIAWKAAVECDLSFTSDLSMVNSRISLDDAALKQLGFAGAEGGDINKLNVYLGDPRTSAESIARETTGPNNETLLHCALDPSNAGHRGFESRLAVTHRLLDVGCLPTSVNSEGQTPLHLWTWGEDANETQQQEFESLVRVLFEKGASILIKDTDTGSNALHWWSCRGLVHIMRAVLNVVSPDDVEKALAMTDDEGATPLMDAIEGNNDDVVKLLLQHRSYQWHDFETLDRSKLLSLAGGIESAPLLQSLIAVGFPITSDNGDSALHHVQETTPSDCIKTLKEHLPHCCSKRVDGRLPVETYLQQWFSISAEDIDPHLSGDQDQHFKVIEQLTNLDTLIARDESGFSVWAFAVNSVSQSSPFSPQRQFTICTGLGYLLQLGYMNSHERSNNECGLVPLLDLLDLPDRQSYKSWPVNLEFLADVINASDRWPQIRESPMALELLRASYSPTFNTPFIRFLLEKEVFPGNREPCAALRSIEILEKTSSDAESWKEASLLAIDRIPNEALNSIDLTEENSGLIHCIGSVWLAEEFIRRGADPNLRTSPRHGNVPALVHHILGGRQEIALCLLANGAKADETDAMGVNAMHAAVIAGNVDILESILPFLGFCEGSSWYSLCRYSCHGTYRTVNSLHLSALKGQLACMEFLLRHDTAQKLRNEPNLAWQTMGFAAMGGHDGIIRYLHQQGFNIDFSNPYDEYTPLHIAVEYDQGSTVKTLIELGAVPVENKEGLTPLTLALLEELPDIAEILDQTLGATNTGPSSCCGYPSSPAPLGQNLMPVFEMAIKEGNIDLCKRLYKFGCPLEGSLSCGGCSLLILALSLHSGPISSWLIREGASVVINGCLKHGNASGLELCMRCKTLDIESTEKFLGKYVEEGGKIINAGILRSAAKSNNPGKMRVLLETMKTAISSRKGNPACAETTSNVTWDVEIEMLVYAYDGTENAAIKTMLAEYIADALPEGEPCPPWVIPPLFSDGWEARTTGPKFCSPSMWKSLDHDGETPLMVGCRHLPLEAISFLVSKGADYQKTNIMGRSVLHIAAEDGYLEEFSFFLRLGVDPHLPDASDTLAIYLAMAGEMFTATLVNQDIGLSDLSPIPWKYLARKDEPYPLFNKHFRLYQRKLEKIDLLRIANLQPNTGWSPLCLTALEGNTEAIGRILDLGAMLDHEGSPEGSALMLACTAGAFSAAKLLVRRGASLFYTSPNGQHRSAMVAAGASPNMTHWLLVGRFIEQPKLCTPKTMEGEEAYKPWSGSIKAEYLIMGNLERDPRESSFDYYKRLMRIRDLMRGQVVPPSQKGRTCRQSRLIPVEKVRRHPDDIRSPQK